jgi:uncharacterized protein (TIGR02453 family)
MPRSPKASSTAGAAGFQGFADEGMKFFKALAKHQDRAWFADHKAAYEEGWAAPMAALLEEASAGIDAAYPDCELEPPKVFRLHRDVRFSADKSPYKTSVSGIIAARRGGKMGEAPAALYVQLGLESILAAGQYMMSGDGLARYRAAVLDEARGAELGKMVKSLEKKGFRLTAAEELKSAPRGIDPGHPRIDLLRKKGLVAMFPAIPAGAVASRSLLDWVVAQARLTAPLVRWLVYATS